MKSGQRTAIARRSLAAVAHACHTIGAGCGWLRCLANAPHHPEGRHKLLEDGCRYALATRGRGGRLPSAPLRSAPVKQLPREADHARRILCKQLDTTPQERVKLAALFWNIVGAGMFIGGVAGAFFYEGPLFWGKVGIAVVGIVLALIFHRVGDRILSYLRAP